MSGFSKNYPSGGCLTEVIELLYLDFRGNRCRRLLSAQESHLGQSGGNLQSITPRVVF